MDGQGLSPVALDETLRNWNSSERNGMRRPKILYTVPVCQNPTGASMSWERKQEVYKVCQEWDVVIVEDDRSSLLTSISPSRLLTDFFSTLYDSLLFPTSRRLFSTCRSIQFSIQDAQEQDRNGR